MKSLGVIAYFFAAIWLNALVAQHKGKKDATNQIVGKDLWG